jgi:acyl carrier protein
MAISTSEVITLIEQVFHLKKGSIATSTPIENVAKDSMDVVEFVAVLKNRRDITINPAEMINVQTVGALINLVQESDKRK